jgi:hypothetical protein
MPGWTSLLAAPADAYADLVAPVLAIATWSVLASDTSKKASGIGLVVILALIAATIFLFRSLSRQLKKLPPTFDADNEPRLPEPADPRDDALAAARGEVPLARGSGDQPDGDPPADPPARPS